jgi:hypothetical protein
VVFGAPSEHRTNIDLVGLSLLDRGNELVLVLERLVSNVDVVFNGERPLTSAKEVAISSITSGLGSVGEPVE